MAIVTLALGSSSLRAQEDLELGKMWTFENPPLDYFEKTYGFRPDQAWLDAVRLASLRFGNGCSASFVSPHGLIMTNHHCARDAIAQASPPDEDWVKNGFVARTLADEVRLPGLTVQQLVSMQDVTAEMNAGLKPGDDDEAIKATRDRNRQKLLETARAAHPDLRPQIVKLFHGGMFQLYSYRIYDDIRLVAAPHLQTAHFGGDPDNFTYPRYGIDFAFCRAWSDGKPVDTSSCHFKWNVHGADEGELVFVTGNPGSTGRLLTYAQLEYTRDVQYPIILDIVSRRLELLKKSAAASAEAEKRHRTEILGLENTFKAISGYLAGLEDPDLMRRKKEAEARFRARIESDSMLRKRYGDVFERLAEIAHARRDLEPKRRFHSDLGIPHLGRALAVIEATSTAGTDRSRRRAARRARRPITEIDRARALMNLQMAATWLPEDDPYRRALFGDASAEEALDHLLQSTKIADDEFVSKLLEGGADAVAAANDPALAAARVIAPLRAKHREERARLDTEEEVQQARLGQALFAVYGTSISPDATFTLRLSDGIVRRFPMNGTIAPPWTSFYGLFGRATEFRNVHPFDLPDVWWQRSHRIDLTRKVDFVSTNDIIGGNSGSPVINANREVVGLVFDGNIEMLPNRFLYRDDVPRAVSVHTEAIAEALTKIYDADQVLEELLGVRAPR